MKRLLVPVALSLFAACAIPPVQHAPTNNPRASVDLLFEHNGCRVYRFRDGWMPIYYSDCRGQSPAPAAAPASPPGVPAASAEGPTPQPASASTFYYVSCGRNCVRPVLVASSGGEPRVP